MVYLIIDSNSLRKSKQDSDFEHSLQILMTKVKLKQMSEIFCEILKLKEGLIHHTCKLRNRLQIFIGEMEIYCNIDILGEVNQLLEIIDDGISRDNWNQIVDIVLRIYEKILKFCN